MIKSKKQMYTVIGAFILVMLLTTVTYAFFNYTRTGTANNIKTGRIYFNTSQDGTLNLTNLFPVASNEVGNDYTEDTVKITVTGDTTYTSGMEYLVTAEEVNVETSTGKKVPLTLNVAVTDDLGTEDTDSDQVEYFTDRGSTTSYYKILSESVLYDGQYLLVGYIAPGQSGVDGTINIKAYIDKDKVAISDTYPSGDVTHTESSGEATIEVFDYTNGTTSNWVNGRVVLTTSEWNSLQTTPLSFKVRVEANEGMWVDPAILVNAAERIPSALTQNITEIYFIKETPIRMERRYNAATVKADMTDTTLNEGQVLAWQEGNKLYIASSGETYLPQNSSGYFSGLSNVTKIEFENVNTSRVTQMNSMFQGCSSLTGIDLSNFDMSNLTQMHAMFSNCTSLRKMDLHNLGNDGLTGISSLFTGCTNLEEINMSGFSFGSGSMIQMFSGLTSLKTVNLANANTQNVTNMKELFKNSSNLINVNLTGNGGNNLSNITDMFTGCTNLVEINMSGFNFGSSLMEYLFQNLTSLKNVNFTNADISHVTQMSRLFSGCSSIETIDMSGLNGASISSSSALFQDCTSLTQVNMSGFNFGYSSYVSLGNNHSIEYLDLSNADMSGVTSMMGGFSESDTLQEVNLSGLVLNNSIKVNALFVNDTNLRTIKVSSGTDWSFISASDSYNMFLGCTSLVGGQGTTYDANNLNSAYAHVDGGEGNRGYFTVSN